MNRSTNRTYTAKGDSYDKTTTIKRLEPGPNDPVPKVTHEAFEPQARA